jgi:glutathione S-transferase
MLECVDSDTGKVIRITQSVAIIEFLEDAFPDTKAIYPRDKAQKARVKEMVEIVNSGIQPLQSSAYLQGLEEKTGGGLNATAQAQEVIHKGLLQLERLVKESRKEFSGPFCAGSFSPTTADFFVIAQIANGRRYGVNIDDSTFPLLVEVEKMVKETNWYESSSPEAQPDFEA